MTFSKIGLKNPYKNSFTLYLVDIWSTLNALHISLTIFHILFGLISLFETSNNTTRPSVRHPSRNIVGQISLFLNVRPLWHYLPQGQQESFYVLCYCVNYIIAERFCIFLSWESWQDVYVYLGTGQCKGYGLRKFLRCVMTHTGSVFVPTHYAQTGRETRLVAREPTYTYWPSHKTLFTKYKYSFAHMNDVA